MARTKQKLINYHSSGSSSTNVFNPVNVDYGEIAVRHKPDEARLYVRTGENTYATFVDSSQTVVMINEMNQNTLRDLNYISGSLISVSGAFVTLSGDFETVSAQVVSNKSSINTLTTDLGVLESNFTSFSAYVESDYKDWEKTKEYIDNQSTNLTQEISKLSGSVIAFSSSVITNYATKTEVASASANAISSSKAYVDAASGDIETTIRNEYATSADTHNAIDTVKTGLDNRIDGINTNLSELSGSVSAFSATVVSMEGDLIDRIESALTVVYKFKGTVDDYEDLANIPSPQNGDVYNVKNAQGTIGDATYVPPGTNYAWVEESGDEPAHWDALGGQVDLSDYVTRGELSAATATTEGVMMDVYSLSGAVSAFSSSVVTNYATSSATHSAIAAASGNVYKSSTAYTNTVSGYIETTIRNEYATSSDTHNAISDVSDKIDTTNQKVETLSGSVIGLSGSVISVKATADAALNEFKLGTVSSPTSTQSGAKAAYVTGGSATLDLSELVIDCGDF